MNNNSSPVSPMHLAVCILHYGRPELTARLHRQFLEAAPSRAADILVLDNAAPEPYPDAWVRLPQNLYWAGAFAWALDALSTAGYTHLWFCNNDMTFVSSPSFLEKIAIRWRWLEKRGRVGLLSPSVTANPYHPQMVAVQSSQCRQVMYVDGIAPVVSLSAVADIGGLDVDDNPFGYGVDIWLSYRLGRAGWGVWVDDTVIIRHQYHTAARNEAGFLSHAATAEDSYMTKRFGTDWKNTLEKLQTFIPQETL